MRRLVMTSLLLLLLPVLTACSSDDPAPLLGDLRWQVRCDCQGMCAAPPGRDVNYIDGEEGFNISCDVFPRRDGAVSVLTASAFQGSEWGIEIRDAEFPPGGGPVSGEGCLVTVRESGNEYQATCGANPPSEEQPCRIYDLVIDTDDQGNPQIRGNLGCAGLPATANPMTRRELTFPRERVDVTMCDYPQAPGLQPAQFRFVNCSGL